MAIKLTITRIPADGADTFISFQTWIDALSDEEKAVVSAAIARQEEITKANDVIVQKDKKNTTFSAIYTDEFENDPEWTYFYNRFLTETNQTISVTKEEI